ncbi:hypothetical protein PMAYCL1PPCAC_09568, partial [Pristionchus mayeri]
ANDDSPSHYYIDNLIIGANEIWKCKLDRTAYCCLLCLHSDHCLRDWALFCHLNPAGGEVIKVEEVSAQTHPLNRRDRTNRHISRLAK